jgi:hypothetical protein
MSGNGLDIETVIERLGKIEQKVDQIALAREVEKRQRGDGQACCRAAASSAEAIV